MAAINKLSASPKRVTGTSKQAGPHQQNARFPSPVNGSTPKGLSLLDEFKNGFPSDGLSIVSNKWWGSKASDEVEAKEDGEQRSDDATAGVKLKDETGSSNVDISGTSLLAAVRRRAATEGREALRMGLFRGRHGNDIGDKERSLLLGLFQSSLPKEWMDNMS